MGMKKVLLLLFIVVGATSMGTIEGSVVNRARPATGSKSVPEPDSGTRQLRRSLGLAKADLGLARAVPVWVALLNSVPESSIEGYVYDQTGTPIKGIKVTVRSPALSGGAKVAYTNDEGFYRIVGLPPGTFEIIATAPKLKTVHQRNIRVAVDAPASVYLIMEVEGEQEAVMVRENAPIVSTSAVREVYEQEFADSLPLDERFAVESFIGHGTAGVRVGGGSTQQNSMNVEGFKTHGQRLSGKSLSALESQTAGYGTESYAKIAEKAPSQTSDSPLSTFAIDVDTASYANVRRFLVDGHLPPADAVRVEELVNYFPYAYPAPAPGVPFGMSMEVNDCPWNADARLVRIGLRGKDVPIGDRPAASLVFLIDVSGSMNEPRKLPLVKDSLLLLAEQLRPRDRVAMVVYAGNAGLVLPSTPASDKTAIREAISRLDAGGSTNGGEGIRLAYRIARQEFIRGGNNRVILATDGDFNVGVTGKDDLVELVAKEARAGVFLTVLGFGTGNLKDGTIEALADKGNGNYAYIDSLREARKVLVEQLSGTILTIAKDVKIQVEFNPARVGTYRLLGYENRRLRKEDFNDDRKDGGEIGAGHTVTALYEITPPGAKVDPLRYQPAAIAASASPEILTLKVRYKEPAGETSKKLEVPLVDTNAKPGAASADFRFAASVAAFGMVLRGSPYGGRADLAMVDRLAREGLGSDAGSYRSDFLGLVRRAQEMKRLSAGEEAASSPRIVIERNGRIDGTLTLDGTHLEGTVRGVPVRLDVKPVEIVGRIGEEPVWIMMHGHEAEGHVGGHQVGFFHSETGTGHMLQGTSVGHAVRLETALGRLSLLPNCGRTLLPVSARERGVSIFQGTCDRDVVVRVTLPDALEQIEPLPRSILLALVLTDHEPGATSREPRLFPAPEVSR